MKIDVMVLGLPTAHQQGLGHRWGGGAAYACHLGAALADSGCDVKFILTKDNPRPDADALFLCSLGVEHERNEKGKARAEERARRLREVAAAIPIYVVFHGVVDISFYRASRLLMRNVPFRGIVVTSDEPVIHSACIEWLYPAPRTVIPIPYEFRRSVLKDRSKFKDTIVSPARIGSNKNTDKILSLAHKLPEYTWRIRGTREGVFWGHTVRKHHWVEGKNVVWIDDPGHAHAYDDAAFAIDLTTFWWGDEPEGHRAQYTTLEAVEAGLIPVTLSSWDNGTWKGVYLPAPDRKNRHVTWDLDLLASRMRAMHYDWKTAQQNFKSMEKVYDIKVVGPKFMRLFESGRKMKTKRRAA